MSYDRIPVPGVFEVPAAIRFAIRSMEVPSAPVHYSGYIAFGCVIRGETSHFEYICNAASRALMDLTLNHGIAMGFGILTCDNREQAWARAAVDQKNKGAETATTCIRMMELKKTFRPVQR
jgi:6,7-dimethyl-8-ribityllumazine synthase